MQEQPLKKANQTWPLASYQPVERRTGERDRRDDARGPDRRRRVRRALRSLLRL